MIENLDVSEKSGEGFEKYSDNRIITFHMILRTEIKTVQKCTYNYSNADVIGMKSYMRRIKCSSHSVVGKRARLGNFERAG